MGASKNRKRVVQKETPQNRHVAQTADPTSYYAKHPAWNFNSCDSGRWGFTQEQIGDTFWSEILPFFKALETKTWSDILLQSKKQNHSIDIQSLNPDAAKRLAERFIEQESIISLRLNGTHRIYGYMVEHVFNILWYDAEHGDNAFCVCRSHKKHT